jgi:hypothetical protein
MNSSVIGVLTMFMSVVIQTLYDINILLLVCYGKYSSFIQLPRPHKFSFLSRISRQLMRLGVLRVCARVCVRVRVRVRVCVCVSVCLSVWQKVTFLLRFRDKLTLSSNKMTLPNF